ncbi:hypothetical protein [uncultured Azohydromonas sp.]|jgi:hypothetical protein|uniref:hypothetical protein n=1 Tax=uncultured Azohydromonas sp. TaxID=487342 RepID=UPI0026278321|nr:hypothetical protein [uncultured Azohydromonas sp.]
MKRPTTLRLACVLSAAGVIATTLAGCASTSATADTPMQPAATTTSAPTGVTPQVTGAGAGSADTRDWAQVDTNRDGLVSPEEMSVYLQNNPGPLKGR